MMSAERQASLDHSPGATTIGREGQACDEPASSQGKAESWILPWVGGYRGDVMEAAGPLGVK